MGPILGDINLTRRSPVLFFEIVCGVPAGVIKHGKLENPEAFDLEKKTSKHDIPTSHVGLSEG